MTAHRSKPTITPERIEWFARYHAAEPAWGEFHVVLDDGNYKSDAAPYHPSAEARAAIMAEWPADLRDAVEWFNTLSPSQKKRLGQKAEAWRPPP